MNEAHFTFNAFLKRGFLALKFYMSVFTPTGFSDVTKRFVIHVIQNSTNNAGKLHETFSGITLSQIQLRFHRYTVFTVAEEETW